MHSVLTVSHLYPSSDHPGRGPFVRDQVVELARRHVVAVVAPIRVGARTWARSPAVADSTMDDCVRVVRPRYPEIPLGGLLVESHLWANRLGPLLRRVQSEIAADVIHAHFALPDGFAAAQFARKSGLPLVLSLWGSDVLQFGEVRRLRGLLRAAFDVARAIIAVSDELAEQAKRLGANSERVRVVMPGVPYRPPVSVAEARRTVAVDQAAPCLVWIGGLVPVKQPFDAIHALEHLRAAGAADALLVLIGDGSLRRDLHRYVERRRLRDAVRFAGHCSRAEVWTWQSAADLLVNTSRSEGTPVAVLEALGAGTHVVSYPVGGIGAAVEAVGGGRLATETTPEALARAVIEELALHQDRERLAEDARARFDIARTVGAIEDTYDAVT